MSKSSAYRQHSSLSGIMMSGSELGATTPWLLREGLEAVVQAVQVVSGLWQSEIQDCVFINAIKIDHCLGRQPIGGHHFEAELRLPP